MDAMDTTFITIHDLTQDARVLYSSDSIVDILGHTPDEVVGRSAWDFFHPDELPMARKKHSHGVKLDKAAVLAYCSIKNRQGQWVGCECCFSVVYDVIVCCTSIYRRGLPSQKRAAEAPIVRRLFTSSPKDPRYHMLTHLSSKFKLGESEQTHEPRAALFLNRFTRTLTIMYATNGIEEIIGIPGEAMKGRSFYYCIEENCLQDAVRCLEGAKGNDSIAYLRFWFRDPRQDDAPPEDDPSASEDDSDEVMTGVSSTDDEEEDGDSVGSDTDRSPGHRSQPAAAAAAGAAPAAPSGVANDPANQVSSASNTSSSGEATSPISVHERLFGRTSPSRRSASSSAAPSSASGQQREGIELEAVVSCTSDGLVVCLRKARPVMPTAQPQAPAVAQPQGIFAAPWAPEPVFFPPLPQPVPYGYYGAVPFHGPHMQQVYHVPGGPVQQDFMRSIRDVAVFAWALTGINGSLASYSVGQPSGESQPSDGFPIWAPEHRDVGSGYESASPHSGNQHPPGEGNGNDYYY